MASMSQHNKEHIMQNGTVKWFDATKGYGLIQPQDNSKDVFVHIRTLEQLGIAELPEGQKVRYEANMNNHGKTVATAIDLIEEMQ